MNRHVTRLVPLALLTLLVVPLWGWPARSYSPFLDQVRALYPYDYACTICHDADHKLTSYGQDFAKALARRKDPLLALKDIEKLDSDGDGVSNGEELRAGTLPEDRFSRPSKAKAKPSASPSP
jgi:hypothetical protein